MFTGIIESVGEVKSIQPLGSNLRFTINSTLAPKLKVDQSLSHNGVCLTVEETNDKTYTVTAIAETLSTSNLGNLRQGDRINLERSLTLQSLVDGHLVQGHVDATGQCTAVHPADGSHVFTFRYPETFQHLLVEKGSITVNGVSLTAFDCKPDHFSVAIIPYTFENTNFRDLQENKTVNLEFDIIGKYVRKNMG